jgi:hypothetical protein
LEITGEYPCAYSSTVPFQLAGFSMVHAAGFVAELFRAPVMRSMPASGNGVEAGAGLSAVRSNPGSRPSSPQSMSRAARMIPDLPISRTHLTPDASACKPCSDWRINAVPEKEGADKVMNKRMWFAGWILAPVTALSAVLGNPSGTGGLPAVAQSVDDLPGHTLFAPAKLPARSTAAVRVGAMADAATTG